MKQRRKLALAVLLCVCMMVTLVAHAASEGRHSTIDTTEYGMILTSVDRESTELEYTEFSASMLINRNSDGATLYVTLSAYEWYGEEDNALLSMRTGRDSSGTATYVSTFTTDSSALRYSNYLFASGAVRGGSSGVDYTSYVEWRMEE